MLEKVGAFAQPIPKISDTTIGEFIGFAEILHTGLAKPVYDHFNDGLDPPNADGLIRAIKKSPKHHSDLEVAVDCLDGGLTPCGGALRFDLEIHATRKGEVRACDPEGGSDDESSEQKQSVIADLEIDCCFGVDVEKADAFFVVIRKFNTALTTKSGEEDAGEAHNPVRAPAGKADENIEPDVKISVTFADAITEDGRIDLDELEAIDHETAEEFVELETTGALLLLFAASGPEIDPPEKTKASEPDQNNSDLSAAILPKFTPDIGDLKNSILDTISDFDDTGNTIAQSGNFDTPLPVLDPSIDELLSGDPDSGTNNFYKLTLEYFTLIEEDFQINEFLPTFQLLLGLPYIPKMDEIRSDLKSWFDSRSALQGFVDYIRIAGSNDAQLRTSGTGKDSPKTGNNASCLVRVNEKLDGAGEATGELSGSTPGLPEGSDDFDARAERVFHGLDPPTIPGVIPAALSQESPPTRENIREIVFIDSRVPDQKTPINSILSKDSSAIKILIIDSDKDGIDQITDSLSAHRDIEAIHIISHGQSGAIRLGNSLVDSETLTEKASTLKTWSSFLQPGADILLYGCNIAACESGEQFVELLHSLSGADVAASNDATGNSEMGGDWDLEVFLGEPPLIVCLKDGTFKKYSGLLIDPAIKFSSLEDGTELDPETIYWNELPPTLDLSEPNENLSVKHLYKNGEVDLSNIDEKLSITLKKRSEVTIKKGNEEKTFKNVMGLIGGNKDDEIKVEHDTKGWIKLYGGNGKDEFTIEGQVDFKKVTVDGGRPGDGDDNENTLIFSESPGRQVINLSGQDISDITSSNVNTNDITVDDITVKAANFQTIKGTDNRTGDILIGKDNSKEIFEGLKGNDKLWGLGGDDELKGGDGNDVFYGGKGEDTLEGGRGADTYVFALEDFLYNDSNIAFKDTVTEINENEIIDILDFTSFPTKHKGQNVLLSFDVNKIAEAGNNYGIKVNLFFGGADKGELFKKPVEYTEKILVGKGENKFNFQNKWGKDFQIVVEQGGNGKVDLNFSDVTHDLLFEIGVNGRVTVYEADPDKIGNKKDDGSKVEANRVRDIIGGKGNNYYKIKENGKLLGKLTGGSVNDKSERDQPAGKQNVLDYSDFKNEVYVNLTDQPINFNTNFAVDDGIERVGPETGVLPVQEKWIYRLPGLDGSIRLKFGNEESEEIQFSSDDDSKEKYEQLFKKELVKLLDRSDFSVDKITDRIFNLTTWKVTFAEPGQIKLDKGDLFSKLKPAEVTLKDEEDPVKFDYANNNNSKQTIKLRKKMVGGKITLTYDNQDFITFSVAGDKNFKFNDDLKDGDDLADEIQVKLTEKAGDDKIDSVDYPDDPSDHSWHSWVVTFKNLGTQAAKEIRSKDLIFEIASTRGAIDVIVSKDKKKQVIALSEHAIEGKFNLKYGADDIATIKINDNYKFNFKPLVGGGNTEGNITGPELKDKIKDVLRQAAGNTNVDDVKHKLENGQHLWEVTFVNINDPEEITFEIDSISPLKFKPPSSHGVIGISISDTKETQVIALSEHAIAGKFKLKYGADEIATIEINDANTFKFTLLVGGGAQVNNRERDDLKHDIEGVIRTKLGNNNVNVGARSENGHHLWTVTFKNVNNVEEIKYVPDRGTPIKCSTLPISGARGVSAVDKEYHVYTNATGGKFKLEIDFQTLNVMSGSNKNIKINKITTEEIKYDASPDQLQDIIEKAVKDGLENSHYKAEVEPNVLVSGMGTKTFPWKIIFANMGNVKVRSVQGQVNLLKDKDSFGANKASGIAEIVTNITNVIGTKRKIKSMVLVRNREKL